VLASEALREDLAPIEPGRRATRLCHASVAVILLGVAFALRAGLGLADGWPSPGAVSRPLSSAAWPG